MDQAVSLFTEDGLKGAAAPCAVHRPVFRPPGIPAVEIAKLHRAPLLHFSSGFFIPSISWCPPLSLLFGSPFPMLMRADFLLSF